MRLRKALILLRLDQFEAIEVFKQNQEIGLSEESINFLDTEITNEQYIKLLLTSTKNINDFYERRPPYMWGYMYHRNGNSITAESTKITQTNKYNDYQKIHIRIGMIIRCNDGDKYGLLVAISSFFRMEKCIPDGRVFYFDKEKDFFVPRYHLVSYIEDISDPNCVNHIVDLFELENVTDEWQAMKDGVPFFYESSSFDLIGIPIEYTSEKVLYYYSVQERSFTLLYAYYLYYRALHYVVIPDYSEIENELCRIRNYVEAFDSKAVFDTYKVGEEGWLQHRCGRDDHFITEKYRIISSTDSYIHSLVPLGLDKSYRYGDSSDENYSMIDEEEINRIKTIANNTYTKESHYAFLKNEYINSIKHIIKEIACTRDSIERHFNIHQKLCDVQLLGIDATNYKSLIAEYNHRIQKQHE